MAEKRMFTKKIIDSDAFLELPLSAQALYFHLNMRADDDGFVNNPKKIAEYVHASTDDINLLLIKRFILRFDSGVIVIKHWRLHNTLRMDRYCPTDYQDELATLGIKPNKAYTDDPVVVAQSPALLPANTARLPDGCQTVATDKKRIEKNREGSGKKRGERDIFVEFAGEDAELLRALQDFEEMRRKAKKPMTDKAKEMLLNKLKALGPREQWPAILSQSVFHVWLSVYPLRDEGSSQGRSGPMEDLQALHAMYEEETP